MSNRNSAALAALTLSLTPLLAQAADRTATAARACAQAMVATLATASAPAPRLVGTRLRDDAPGMTLLQSNLELDLTAVNVHTHRTVAQARCEVNTRGEVLSIRPRPLAAS